MSALTPQQVNQLFILLHRSLLQYVGECWPWTSEFGRDVEALTTVKSLIAKQKQDGALLSGPLLESGWPIDFGGYPTAFTDLQYLSLSYLLKLVVKSQSAIVAALESAAQADSESPALRRVADSEREILKAVELLVATKSVPASVV